MTPCTLVNSTTAFVTRSAFARYAARSASAASASSSCASAARCFASATMRSAFSFMVPSVSWNTTSSRRSTYVSSGRLRSSS